MRTRLSDPYVDALRLAKRVPEGADFVMYWWDEASSLVRLGRVTRFGFVTTNSISQGFNAGLVDEHLNASPPLSLAYCIPNAPWVDEHDGADVRVSMTVGVAGRVEGRLVDAKAGLETTAGFEKVGWIGANLKVGADVRSAVSLISNQGLCAVGYQLNGKGFIISSETEKEWRTVEGPSRVVFPLRNGSDINRRSRDLYVIDLDVTPVSSSTWT